MDRVVRIGAEFKKSQGEVIMWLVEYYDSMDKQLTDIASRLNIPKDRLINHLLSEDLSPLKPKLAPRVDFDEKGQYIGPLGGMLEAVEAREKQNKVNKRKP